MCTNLKYKSMSFYMCMYLCKLYPGQNMEYFQLCSRPPLYRLSGNNYFFPGGNHHFDLYYLSFVYYELHVIVLSS